MWPIIVSAGFAYFFTTDLGKSVISIIKDIISFLTFLQDWGVTLLSVLFLLYLALWAAEKAEKAAKQAQDDNALKDAKKEKAAKQAKDNAMKELNDNALKDAKKELVNSALLKKDSCLAYQTFKEMARDDQNREMFKEAGLTQLAKDAHQKISKMHMESLRQKYQDKFHSIKLRLRIHIHLVTHMVMASAPEIGLDGMPVLAMASWAVQAIGGFNIAGDAHDRFHKLLMDAATMTQKSKGWRQAWQGKLEGVLSLCCPDDAPHNSIILFSLKGGPETEWERQYLLNDLRDVHTRRNITVVCLESHRELLDYLENL